MSSQEAGGSSPTSTAAPRRRFSLALRVLIAAGLLVLLFQAVDLEQTVAVLTSVEPLLLVPLLALNTAAYVLFALRWQSFRGRLGLDHALGRCLEGVYLFQVTSQVAPSPLLGEAARFAAFSPGASKVRILQSIVLDRLSNQLALVFWVTSTLPLTLRLDLPERLRLLLLVPGAAVLLLWFLAAAVARLLRRRGSDWPRRLGFLAHLVRGPAAAWAVVLGLFLCAVLGFEFALAARALPVAAPRLPVLVLLVPVLMLATALLPISYADWGTREVMALLLLTPAGLSREEAVAVSLLIGVVNLLASLPGLYFVSGVLNMRRNAARKRAEG
jgi:uncharacterized membrane protein YbhN (UPF0104 family)